MGDEEIRRDSPPGEEADPLVLRSPAQFKALGHPVRHRIVNVLRQRPATLGQLSSALGSAKGTIAHHVRILREAGFVQLAGTRQVRGGTEQYYALVSGAFKHDREAPVGPEFIVNAAVAEMLPPRPGEADVTLLNHLWLTRAEARELAARLHDLAHECAASARPGRGEAYGLLLSLYKADIPALSPEMET